MSFKEFVKSKLKRFFFLVTCFTTIIALVGVLFRPDHTFGYESFFTPVIFGAIVVLSSYILYINHLSKTKTLLIRIIHFFAFELVLCLYGLLRGYYINSTSVLIYLAFTIILYIIISVVVWIKDIITADSINKGLKKIRD